VTAERVATGMRFVLSRHQSLRTRLRFDGAEWPRQELWPAGEARLEIYDAGDADPAQLAEEIRFRYETTVFDYPNEWPMKMAVVRRGQVLTHVIAGYCHLALDAFGLQALIADLATMDPATGGGTVPVDAIQPLELARRQQEPAMQRQGETSLRHLERLLQRIPARRFREPTEPQTPRYQEIHYNSPAALLAAQVIAARTRLGTGPALLAGAAVAVVRLTGSGPAVLQVLVNNRFRPGFAAAVTPLTQSGVCVVEVDDAGFDEVVARSMRAATRAAKNAYYDPVRANELIAAAGRERGEEIDLSVFLNDRRTQDRQQQPDRIPTAADVRAALPASTLRWGHQLERFDHKLFIHVNDVSGALDWMVCADTAYVPPAALEAFARDLEAVLVEAALAGAAEAVPTEAVPPEDGPPEAVPPEAVPPEAVPPEDGPAGSGTEPVLASVSAGGPDAPEVHL
jgi:hypothetical protein